MNLTILYRSFNGPTAATLSHKRVHSLKRSRTNVRPALAFLSHLATDSSVLGDMPPLMTTRVRPFTLYATGTKSGTIHHLTMGMKEVSHLVHIYHSSCGNYRNMSRRGDGMRPALG